MCNSNTRQSLFCNAIATVLGMASMGVGMTSLVSNDWISDGSANKSGLLESCSESTGCQPYSEVQVWIAAVLSFIGLMIGFTTIGNVANWASHCIFRFRARQFSAYAFAIGGFCGAVGVVTYVAVTQSDTDHIFEYGVGFYTSCAAVICALCAGMLNQISAKKLLAGRPQRKPLGT